MDQCVKCGRIHVPADKGSCRAAHMREIKENLAKRFGEKVVVHTEPVVVHQPESVSTPVVHSPPPVVHTEVPVVHKKGESRYKDPDARKAYRREWMRKKRLYSVGEK